MYQNLRFIVYLHIHITHSLDQDKEETGTDQDKDDEETGKNDVRNHLTPHNQKPDTYTSTDFQDEDYEGDADDAEVTGVGFTLFD